MRNILFGLLAILCLTISYTAKADTFESQANYTVCFTPGEDCTGKIVDVINNAISNVWVQAYSFTSRPIARALVLAKERGVNVKVILDKQSINGNNNNVARYLARNQIPLWVDTAPAIAHNKVIIIDETETITGSFNFTRAAQQQNAENVLIIYDSGLAKKYLTNWQRRQHVSQMYKTKVYTTANDFDQTDEWQKFWQWLLDWINKLLHWQPT